MKVLLLAVFLMVVAANAAVTARVVEVAGVPRIAVDGVPRVGTAVMPACKAPPGGSLDVLRAFADVGVRFSSDVWTMKDKRYTPKQWWLGEGRYDWDLFDRLAHGLVDASADGYIFPRIKIDPPDDWLAAHPEAKVGSLVDCASPAWRQMYQRMLADMIAHVEKSDYADRVVGYHIGALHCGEWLYGDGIKSRLSADDWTRLANIIADAIIDSATVVKELTGGRKLVGAFALYCGRSHAMTMRVLRSGKVDFYAAPPCYGKSREPGSPGRSQLFYQASVRLHGGVYYEESDFRSYLSEAACAPEGMTRRRPLDETLVLMRRSIGKSLAGGWENWWFHLGGNATYSHPEMMATVRRGVEVQRETLQTPWKPAEVAVFASASSMKNREGRNRMLQWVLPVCGVPMDVYEADDAGETRLPDYRICLALDGESLSPAHRARLEARGVRIVMPSASATADDVRKALRAAGAYVWLETPDVLAVGRGFLMLHAASDGEKTIRLPRAAALEEIFGTESARPSAQTHVLLLRKGETRVWRLKEER